MCVFPNDLKLFLVMYQNHTLLIDICNNFGALQLSSEDPEDTLTVFRNAFHSSAVDTLGYKSRKHQDWFGENDKKVRIFLKKNITYTRYTKMTLDQYLTLQSTTTFL